MVIRKIPHYDFSALQLSALNNTDFLQEKFYLLFPPLPTFTEEKTLLSIPGALEIKVICRTYGEDTPDMDSLKKEGCFLFNTEKEWILEADCTMCTNDGKKQETFPIRLPLSAPFAQGAALALYYDGTWFRFMQGGELLNENTGFDHFCVPTGAMSLDPALDGVQVAVLSNPIKPTYREETSDVSPDFFFPYGWNANVGDVMTFSHDGAYHLMYLIDRRHHQSRNGAGAHYIVHLTTNDLIHWQEQEPIAEITEPWMAYGTGTMLYNHGKYYMTYGFHTERYADSVPKIEPVVDEKTQTFSPLTLDKVFEQGGVPAGAAWSVSDDGIHFTPGGVLFHTGRNPSAYTNESGGVSLYAGYMGSGVWASESFDHPFAPAKSNFAYTDVSIMRNSAECPAFFSWNGYRYLIVGFTGYFRTTAPGSDDYVDAGVALGESVYDGLAVPMVAELPGNRRVIAGWVRNQELGWGGVLMQRELIQEEGGCLGMRWLPEITPVPVTTKPLCSKCLMQEGVTLNPDESYRLEMTINPGTAGTIALNFSDGEKACALQLDLARKRASVSDAVIDGFGDPAATMLEVMQKLDPEITDFRKAKNLPHHARNYALPDIQGMDSPFTLKVMIRRTQRLKATVLDAEIAGRRTIISLRPDFYPTRVRLVSDGAVTLSDGALSTIASVEC